MANEAGPLTVNAAGTSWVDVTPGAVSTGYQAQNTNIEAGRVGMDATHVEASGGDAILRVSGPVDVDGVLYSIESEVTLSPADGTWYILLTAGTGDDLTPTTSASKGSWVSAKNGLYLSGERVLNWVLERSSGVMTVLRISPNEAGLNVNGDLQKNGVDVVTLDEAQTITGNKSFTGTIGFDGSTVDINTQVRPRTDPVTGTQSIASATPFTPNRGFYNASSSATTRGGYISANVDNYASGAMGGPYPGTSDVRVLNNQASSQFWQYARF